MINSFKCAFSGLFIALKKERNLKIHCSIMILVIIAGIFFNISNIEWLVCLLCFGLVISLELVNTALEKMADMIDDKYNLKIKEIKDIAAAAVLFSAIITAIIGLIIFIPKL